MNISYDLRFAHLPCGSWPYVCNAIRLMSLQYPHNHWRIYFNDYDPPQQKIADILRQQQLQTPRLKDHFEFVPVQHTCLTWQHHLEFRKFSDSSQVYHYLHFDMPLSMKGPALVLTVHDLYPLVLPGYCSPAKQMIFKFIAGRNMKRAARVITVSENTRRDIIKHFKIDPRKIVVIHQGYSPQFQPVDDENRLKTMKEKYQLPPQFILYTGNHKPHKNLTRLLEAYARLTPDHRRRHPLVMTGPISPETQQLKALAASLNISDSIQFLGLVDFDDLPALYNLADLFVLPSLYEGFGIPLVEAMACGTPVICSNRGAMPEVVGPHARLFDPYSIENITDTLTTALNRDIDNQALINQIQDHARSFTWQRNAERTYQVYLDAAH